MNQSETHDLLAFSNSTVVLKPDQVIVRLILYYIIALLSIICNLIILIVIARDRKLRTKSNLFIVNLAIVDVITGCAKDVFLIITLRYQHWIFDQTVCEISGFINIICYDVTMITLTFIAVFRYITVFHGKHIRIRKKHVIGAINIVWILSLMDCTLPLIGFGRYIYIPHDFLCLPVPDKIPGYLTYLVIVFVLVPFIVITFCYLAILLRIFSNNHRIARQLRLPHTSSRHFRAQSLRREIETTWRMFFVYLAFIISFVPYAIIVYLLLPARYNVSLDVQWVAGFLVCANSAVNPFIYYIMYPKMRKACNSLLYSLVNPNFRLVSAGVKPIKIVPK
ncbi:Rhodopsin, GQ-coupled [Trichoplax sp. H2]|nr:Rhodopsin, GQ-coupled [Trichoplax sp. H2]|eukprot:RDD42742.1 Rhodopsin, GQ-coupled [Trichoplax sp. H2]